MPCPNPGHYTRHRSCSIFVLYDDDDDDGITNRNEMKSSNKVEIEIEIKSNDKVPSSIVIIIVISHVIHRNNRWLTLNLEQSIDGQPP